MTVVIGVSAPIGTGKTAFVSALCAALGASSTSFGDYVRNAAKERGMSEDRDSLQQLGTSLKTELGDEGFARAVLLRASSDEAVVVDGIRHVEIANHLQEASAPRRFVLVYLLASDEIRLERLKRDRGQDAANIDMAASRHSTEVQVHDGSLQERADLVLDTSSSTPDELARQVIDWLGRPPA